MVIKIDPELKSLIPPLSPEEMAQLEENIMEDGCRDPLVLWDATILDGHNRHDICTRNGIVFGTVRKSFSSRDDAKAWIIRNQFGRRNITLASRCRLAETLAEVIRRKAAANLSASGGDRKSKNRKSGSSILRNPIDTHKQAAKEAGVSDGSLSAWRYLKENMEPEELAKLERDKNAKLHRAVAEIKKKKRQAEIESQREAIESGKVELPSGVFEVVVMDPPWAYGTPYDPDGRRNACPYPEMTQGQLLELQPPFAKDCVLFLWTTHAFLFDAKALLDRWGFTYKATMVWDKQSIGMGAWLRMQCEFCLIGVRGRPTWSNTTWRDIISERRREHSRKPDAFYKMVEDVTVGRRLDYFSREQRNGWESFGNDTKKF